MFLGQVEVSICDFLRQQNPSCSMPRVSRELLEPAGPGIWSSSTSLTTLTALEFLGFVQYPSLGEILALGKANTHASRLGLSGFSRWRSSESAGLRHGRRSERVRPDMARWVLDRRSGHGGPTKRDVAPNPIVQGSPKFVYRFGKQKYDKLPWTSTLKTMTWHGFATIVGLPTVGWGRMVPKGSAQDWQTSKRQPLSRNSWQEALTR